MIRFYSILMLSVAFALQAQIKGTVTDTQGNPIPYANIFIQNTYKGTTSNENGAYELNISEKGTYTVVFKNLGYKTQQKTIQANHFPQILNVVLEEETYMLNEVVVKNGVNPAIQIIKNAIKNRKSNALKSNKFEADFYSKGIFRVANMPKKILGQDIGDFDGSLDSVKRSGIIYLSETVSKIQFDLPNNFKERIIASKISGNDSGFSYNTALNTNFDCYENTIDFGAPIISPIAENAFNYYKYELENTFYDQGKLINKIKLIAKRDAEPVLEGYIFIIDDTWAVYGLEAIIKGYRIQQPMLESMNFTQQFSYNSETQLWAKNIQTLDFKAKFFGIEFTGKFTHVFSNYNFKEAFAPKTFTSEVVSFEQDANKKELNYWNEKRPVPLTDEEINDYKKKDSIQTLRKSQKYLDSIDTKNNKFKIFDIATGYTYKNSFKKYQINYQGILNPEYLNFNTVQGYTLGTGVVYSQWNDETGKYTRFKTNATYGFSEKKIRIWGEFYHKFNNQNKPYLFANAGLTTSQFNASEPISTLVNTISTLFFKNNFLKMYQKTFAEAGYGQEVFNGLTLHAGLSYAERTPLFNTTDYTIIKKDKPYTSNNPQQPNNYTDGFDKNHITKISLQANIRFGQKYITRPDAKINISDSNYPSLNLTYQKGFLASQKDMEYDKIVIQSNYNKTLGNKGDFSIQWQAGKFFNAKNINFIDYQHFNGNQTHILGLGSNRFNLLPYYTHSTNKSYMEIHAQHNFNGYLLNKIPLIQHLKLSTVIGYHNLSLPNQKPYNEFSIGLDRLGFGKYRFLRIDYVRSYNGTTYAGDGIMFGIKM